MSIQYLWKGSYRGYKGDPELVGREFERIQEENGSISAAVILESAAAEESILHPFFEWDDAKAAKGYRLEQARYLIRNIEIEIEKPNGTPLITRAFVEIKGEAGPYLSLPVVIQDTDLRNKLIEQALKDIEMYERKYQVLEEIIQLITPIKTALKQLVEA